VGLINHLSRLLVFVNHESHMIAANCQLKLPSLELYYYTDLMLELSTVDAVQLHCYCFLIRNLFSTLQVPMHDYRRLTLFRRDFDFGMLCSEENFRYLPTCLLAPPGYRHMHARHRERSSGNSPFRPMHVQVMDHLEYLASRFF